MAILRPEQTLKGFTLDARPSTKLGHDLYEEIVKSVKHTQDVIMLPLPSWLIVTQQQFASLNSYTDEMYHTTDRMMNTGYNVMEIEIDREYGKHKAVDEAMELTDTINRQRKEGSA